MTVDSSPAAFRVLARDGEARASRLLLGGRGVDLPAFMPVGTAAAVKTLAPAEVAGAGFGLILANTYHLLVRPGVEIVERAGGIARFMAWDGPVLTDSGGFQVFSLADRCKVSEEGVRFASHVDGSPLAMTPEQAYDAQRRLGTDVAMALDVCPPGDAGRDEVARAAQRTTRWLDRTLAARREGGPLVFGIAQGGVIGDLRAAHVAEVGSRPVDGVALGGFSVGEDPDLTAESIARAAPLMPADRPRYLMGMGRPVDILRAVASGIDLFDCVLPTRNARNGQAFTSGGRISIKWARFREDPSPLDPACSCLACRTFDRRYLRHLWVAGEMLCARLLTLHNLTYYGTLMESIRSAVRDGRLADLRSALDAARDRDLAPGPGDEEETDVQEP